LRIAIVGEGGREHAIGWKLRQEDPGHEIMFLPGNGGTGQIGQNFDVEAGDVDGISTLAARIKPDLFVIGPESPLALGIADRLTAEGHKVFGPNAACARIESSKAFAKELMSKYDIPTAPYKVFTSKARAHAYVDKSNKPLVVKADGLARGKGAIVAKEKEHAHAAIELLMTEKAFGEAGNTVLIEEMLTGEEASILAITDGRKFVMLPPSQDHKAIFDRDRGPNTGGMGAYSPAPVIDDNALGRIEDTVFKRLLKGLAKEGLEYRGAIYAGLIVNAEGIFVIEFNARFGDPEMQSILPAIDTPIGDLLVDATNGNLKKMRRIEPARWAVCVVAASGGYPGPYEAGKEITGIDKAASRRGVIVFHAATKKLADGKLVTAGGRVLGITGTGSTLRQARHAAYEASRIIRFERMHMRTDIGLKGLRRLNKAGVIQT
jgi:phosphoribosylamine--glycine ligase